MAIPAAAEQLLSEHQCAELFEEANGRLRCKLNGHCVPLSDINALRSFLAGKKFQKLKKEHDASAQLDKFAPFLVPSQRVPGYLFCALTQHLVKAHSDAAKKHMKGQRFQRAKARFLDDELELADEPLGEEAKPLRRAGHSLKHTDEEPQSSGGGSDEMDVSASDAADSSAEEGTSVEEEEGATCSIATEHTTTTTTITTFNKSTKRGQHLAVTRNGSAASKRRRKA